MPYRKVTPRIKYGDKTEAPLIYCPGFLDKFNQWNNGYFCPTSTTRSSPATNNSPTTVRCCETLKNRVVCGCCCDLSKAKNDDVPTRIITTATTIIATTRAFQRFSFLGEVASSPRPEETSRTSTTAVDHDATVNSSKQENSSAGEYAFYFEAAPFLIVICLLVTLIAWLCRTNCSKKRSEIGAGKRVSIVQAVSILQAPGGNNAGARGSFLSAPPTFNLQPTTMSQMTPFYSHGMPLGARYACTSAKSQASNGSDQGKSNDVNIDPVITITEGGKMNSGHLWDLHQSRMTWNSEKEVNGARSSGSEKFSSRGLLATVIGIWRKLGRRVVNDGGAIKEILECNEL